MSREKQMINDLIEIFDEEYEKRGLITPQNTAEKMTTKGYRKQSESFSRPHENDGEWISVEDRLPEHLQKILIYDEFQKMTVATYIAYSNGGGDWSTPVRINWEITHWMPLPEAPKKGGGE